MYDGKLQWHPAFFAGIQIELEDDADYLIFEEEHLLSKKPMQIDTVIIKKTPNIEIKKSIGHIFKGHNIIEYKSPGDYISINDFYKTYGYACFYQSDTPNVLDINPRDITITFVCSHYPKNMINHVTETRKLSVTKYDQGIYHLTGDVFDMQIVIIPELSKKVYYWIQNLRTDLKSGGEIDELINRYDSKKQSTLYQSIVNVIIHANWEEAEVEKKMCEALRELFADELAEMKREGLNQGIQQGIKQGIEQGIEQGQLQQAIRMVKNSMVRLGLSLEEACSLAEISVETYEKNM